MRERLAPQGSIRTPGELVFDAAIAVEEWAVKGLKKLVARSASPDKPMDPVLESGTAITIFEDTLHIVPKKKP